MEKVNLTIILFPIFSQPSAICCLLFILQTLQNQVYSQCFTENTGKGLYLYSPLKTKLTLYKPVIGKEWGDTTYRKCAGFGPMTYRKTTPAYVVKPGTPVFAANSGIIRLFTSGGNDEPNDAAWIDAGNYSTSYFNIYFTLASNQFVYSGQRIGTVIPRKDTTYIYFGIRYAKPEQPIMKRVGLPVAGDNNNNCSCYIDPVFPEHFVNPTSWNIHWDYNDSEPQTNISINSQPSGAGFWSFDEGKTWLKCGEDIKNLPQKYYRITFKELEGFVSPLPIEFTSNNSKTEYQFNTRYTSLNSTPNNPLINLKNTDEKTVEVTDSSLFYAALDEAKKKGYDSNYNELRTMLYNTFNDSLKSKIIAIESEQEIQKRVTYIIFLLLPLLIITGFYLFKLKNKNKLLASEKKQVIELQKELHHRVRNNLSIILGLVDGSAISGTKNFDPKELENRIKSIGFVHDQLFTGNDQSKVEMQPLLETVCTNIIKSYGLINQISQHISVPLIIPAKLATSIILIITELITNAVKHGKIQENKLEIKITGHLSDNNTMQFLIEDNGKGFKIESKENLEKSYGLRMVYGLVKQIKGKIKIENKDGTHVKLII